MALKFDIWFRAFASRILPAHLRNSIRCTSTFADIPQSPKLPILGSLPYFLIWGGQKYLHRYVDNLHKKIGPIFRDKIAGKELLFISDPDVNLQVYRSEGSYPEHFLLDIWTEYLEETGQRRGLFFMDGEEWHKYRQILNRQLLHPNSMEKHVETIASVCKDLVKVWKNTFPRSHLEYHLYSWNIECIGAIAIGSRLGFIDKLREENLKELKDFKEDEFAKAIHSIFLETANLYILPAKLAKFVKPSSWKRFYSAVSKSLNQGRKYVMSAIEKCSSESGDNIQNCLLYKLLKQEQVDEQNATLLLVDLLLASADTTSHTARWALYLLGKNPLVAEEIRKEVCSVCTKGNPLNMAAINDCQLLRGVIKETLRLYPTAPFLTRKLAKETTLQGFKVPAGTMIISSLYTMGRDHTHFSDPEIFQPQRWARSSHNLQNLETKDEADVQILNKRAYVPWGLGGRSCIGKRIAELELSLLLMEVLLAFDWTVEEDIHMVLRMVSVPSKDFNLNLNTVLKHNS